MNTSKHVLRLSEWFYSIQGEGRFVGVPAAFIRFGFCNLKCVWCDSKYTWDFANYDLRKEISSVAVQDVLNWVRDLPSDVHVVMTGGEPLLSMHTEGQIEFLRGFRSHRRQKSFVEVETAGTLVPDRELDLLVDHYNVSPKLHNSGNTRKKRWNEAAMNWFAMVRDRADFKFVVSTYEDVKEIQSDFENRLPFLTRDRIFLMPEASTRISLRQNGEWLLELCKNEGYRYTHRLQIWAYNDSRGV